MGMKRLRLRNALGEDGGGWIVDNPRIINYAKDVLEDLRTEEPFSGWRLEARGDETGWHIWRE